MQLEAIGTFHCAARYAYDAARQPGQAHASTGWVELAAGRQYEQAVQDLAGCSRIWLIYQFHHNAHWKPMVTPPRAERKVGVFATRAPYRPNALGLSCVELLGVAGLRVQVAAHDLLDATPIFDIKPYVAYADSFPEARVAWLDALDAVVWRVAHAPLAATQLDWLESQGGLRLRAFLAQQLCERPLDTRRKRIRALGEDMWEIAYRTWRARYSVDTATGLVLVEAVGSGYSEKDLGVEADRYADKALHRAFLAAFPAGDIARDRA